MVGVNSLAIRSDITVSTGLISQDLGAMGTIWNELLRRINISCKNLFNDLHSG